MNTDITSIINQLSEKLSAPAQQAWGILLKQQIIFGWVDLLCGFLMILFTIITVKILLARDERNKLKYLNSSNCGYDCDVVRVSLWVANIIFGIWGTSLIVYGFMYLNNPSYWAIMSLIGGGGQQ